MMASLQSICQLPKCSSHYFRCTDSPMRRNCTICGASTKPRVVVLGAGVVGLTAALRLATESQISSKVDVQVVAERFLDETTSHGSGGFWMPVTLAETPMDLIERWGAPSFRRFADLHRSSEAEASGVQLMQVISVSDEPGRERPPWAHMVPLFRDLTSRDLELAGLGEFKDGFTFSSFVADPWRYLPYLQSKCRDAGVTLTAAKVASLEQLADMAPGSSNVVVNCTGLGAKELFGDDLVYPVRGQIIRVRAPWVRAVWHVNDDTYIIPNTGAVVLGGTRQVGNGEQANSDADMEGIMERCCRLLPALREAEVVKAWAGLRPGRPCVRLDAEVVRSPETGREMRVVHCYGHGGSGVTLAWGCAADIVGHVEEMLC